MYSTLFYVLLTIIGTVAGQLMLKSGMLQVGQMPSNTKDYLPFFFKALTNFRVILSLFLAFIAAMGWIAAVSKLKLSYAYPFMASTFAIVLIFSRILFNEEISLIRWIGVFVIWFGVFLVSRS
jgi:multidrug transporter EmrE-like cation transporter